MGSEGVLYYELLKIGETINGARRKTQLFLGRFESISCLVGGLNFLFCTQKGHPRWKFYIINFTNNIHTYYSSNLQLELIA